MPTNKVLYGLLTFGPFSINFILILTLYMSMISPQGYALDETSYLRSSFIPFIMLGSILDMVAAIIFLFHISRNLNVEEGKRIGWMIGMFFGGTIARLIYFFNYVIREEQLTAKREARFSFNQNRNFRNRPKKNPFD